jgi:hypothetical protein
VPIVFKQDKDQLTSENPILICRLLGHCCKMCLRLHPFEKDYFLFSAKGAGTETGDKELYFVV